MKPKLINEPYVGAMWNAIKSESQISRQPKPKRIRWLAEHIVWFNTPAKKGCFKKL